MDNKIIDLSEKLAKKNLESILTMQPGTKEYVEFVGKTTDVLTWMADLEHHQTDTAIKLKSIEVDTAKNASYVSVEEKKLESQEKIEEKKIDAQRSLDNAKIEAQKDIERTRNESNEKLEKKRSVSGIIIGLLGAISGLSAIGAAAIQAKNNCTMKQMELESMDRRFMQATKKEFDEPISTLTNKTIVQNGLRNY